MASLSGKKTYKNLLKKGFRDSKNKSNDHKWIEFVYNGKLTPIHTKLSRNDQDLGDFLIKAMAKQIKLEKSSFIEFANCKLTEEDYISILLRNGSLK